MRGKNYAGEGKNIFKKPRGVENDSLISGVNNQSATGNQEGGPAMGDGYIVLRFGNIYPLALFSVCKISLMI